MKWRVNMKWIAAVVVGFHTQACTDAPVGPHAADGSHATARTLAAAVSAEHRVDVKDRYIVVVRDNPSGVADHARRLGGGASVHAVWEHGLLGIVATLPGNAAEALRRHPQVRYIEPDKEVRIFDTVGPELWNLDRIDQRSGALDLTYTYSSTASGYGVRAYVFDTGIRMDHPDFTGRVYSGYDAHGGLGNDCNGHGTRVAGTLGGTRVGVAKRVTLVAVRVLNCNGGGTVADVIGGINWLINHHRDGELAVANMSFGAHEDQIDVNGQRWGALIEAVERLVADGVVVVAAAGNSYSDACEISPAAAPSAITVGATMNGDLFWKSGADDYGSNTGPCLDLLAPGVEIVTSTAPSTSTKGVDGPLDVVVTFTWDEVSASFRPVTAGTAQSPFSNELYVKTSGTSIAAPAVAGAAANWMSLTQMMIHTPASVTSLLLRDATVGVVANVPPGTPNRLLYIPWRHCTRCDGGYTWAFEP